MTRAVRASRRSAARVVMLLLAAGVSVSACTGAPAGAGHGHESPAVSQEALPADVADRTATSAQDSEDPVQESADSVHDAHGGGDASADLAAATSGPPRPADPRLECGTTVLPDGEQITRYCEEGTAVFVAGGDRSADVVGATCEDRGALFLAHFGANYSDDAAARGDYLGLALEEMPRTDGPASIYALELTLDGYRQAVAEATVAVTREGGMVGLDLVGELSDGRSLSVEATCHVHDD